MSQVVWKDVSSYSQGDKVRTPSVWSAHFGSVRVTVHRHIHYSPDVWLLSALPWFDKFELLAKDADAAKREALTHVASSVKKTLDAFSRFV